MAEGTLRPRASEGQRGDATYLLAENEPHLDRSGDRRAVLGGAGEVVAQSRVRFVQLERPRERAVPERLRRHVR